MTEKRISRRDLLKAAAATAAFTIVPRHVLGGAGFIAPSEKLTRAIIGTGNMGRWHITMPGAELLAICDADARNLKLGQDWARNYGQSPKLFRDFREILARPDIDVIHIATPPHWHALMAIMAAEAGKDIWCEKPMTRTVREGQLVQDAVRRAGRMFRVNTGSRYGAEWYGTGMNVIQVKRLVDAQMFGWPLKVNIGKATGFDWKLERWRGVPGLPEQPVPPELDYEMWLGPAPWKPYHADRVHLKFRGFWDYDGGGLGDMGQHYLDPIQYLLGKDQTSPVEIEADAPSQHPDTVGYWRTIRLKYADGCEIVLDGSSDDKENVPILEGPSGKLFKNYQSSFGDLEGKLASLPPAEPQNTDFYECVRKRTLFTLNEQNGHRSCTLVNLAKAAVRIGRVLHFDPDKQLFLNDDDANRMISEPMRAPWHL